MMALRCGLSYSDRKMNRRLACLFNYLIPNSSSQRVCLLDADMLVFQNMDELLEMDLPEGGIAANHACCCNWSRDKWAMEEWQDYFPANALYTISDPNFCSQATLAMSLDERAAQRRIDSRHSRTTS